MPAGLLNAEVQRSSGDRVTLASLIGKGPALLVFLRHFGCVHCSRQVDRLMRRLPELEALGIRVVLIGNGPASEIEPFRDRLALEHRRLDVVTDPTLAAFRAAGLERSLLGLASPRAMLEELRAFASGYFPRRRSGDVAQLGGVLLVDDQMRLAYYHKSRTPGDLADGTDVIQAVLALTAMRSAREVMV